MKNKINTFFLKSVTAGGESSLSLIDETASKSVIHH